MFILIETEAGLMTNRMHAGIDAGFAVLLLSALGMVYFVDGRMPEQADRTTEQVDTKDQPGPPQARLAVTLGKHDKIRPMLTRLGYQIEDVDESALADVETCRKYDAIFLTCAGSKRGGGANDAAGNAALGKALRDFVAGGGTLYASDMQFETLKEAFGSILDLKSDVYGRANDRLEASIVDAGLRELLGVDVLPLEFDQDYWRPAAFVPEKVSVYLKATFPIVGHDDPLEAPLLVSFRHGKGTVFFTSFHNETANAELMPKLMEYLVASTVLARVESDGWKGEGSGEFSPPQRSLLTISSKDENLNRTYNHERPGNLRFLVGFDSKSGGTLCVRVIAPDGQVVRERTEGGTILEEIPDAAVGTWKVNITPVDVPHGKLAFVLKIGEPLKEREDAGEVGEAVAEVDGEVVYQIVRSESEGRVRKGLPRIGVTPREMDHMGGLLQSLGDGFQYKDVSYDDLLDPGALQEFDILFLTCGPWPREWSEGAEKGAAERGGLVRVTIQSDKEVRLGEALRGFVENGGTLYASDLRAEMLYTAFPGRQPMRSQPNVALLNHVVRAEERWIEETLGVLRVEPLMERLRKAGLTEVVSKEPEFSQLVAVVEASRLVDGTLKGPNVNVPQTVLNEISGLSVEDATIVGETVQRWDEAIRSGFKNRNARRRNDAQESIKDAETRLATARSRLTRPGNGAPQSVMANVVDPGLREALGLGESIPLKFDLTGWYPARFEGDDVTVFLKGKFRQTLGPDDWDTAPLLVKFPEGEGSVIFTSFHNETVNSDVEKGLLRHLVFAAMMAEKDNFVVKQIGSGRFLKPKQVTLTHEPGVLSVPRTHRTTSDRPVRFAVTIGREGARFQFALKPPHGKEKVWDVDSTFIVEASGAPAGEWIYKVTAVGQPTETIPWSVSVSESTAEPERAP